MKILVTGATGFVGARLCQVLEEKGHIVDRVSRHLNSSSCIDVGDIGPDTNWQPVLRDPDVIVHLAARVHVMRDLASDPFTEFRRVNADGTLNLARQAALSGVRRFVFISSIKVNGELTRLDKSYSPDDVPVPIDPYGISKHEAEIGLKKIAQDTGMEIVFIRPVLVYGPGVKANFLSMMQWLYKGIPLPFGAIHNKRSLVALDNLVDLIVTCIDHPAAANQTFLVSDGEDLSTTDLLKRTATALNRPARLVPIPEGALELGLKILGKGDLAQRLCGSLQVDISKTRELLGWTPPVSVDEALKKTADAFLANVAGK